MAFTSYIGGLVAISVAVPATFDQTGYQALTWTNIVEIVSHGALSDKTQKATVTYLVDGRTTSLNTSRKIDDVPISMTYNATDSGQDLVRANANTNTSVSMRFTDNDGHVHYCTGILSDRSTNTREAGGFKGMDVMFHGNKAFVEVGG